VKWTTSYDFDFYKKKNYNLEIKLIIFIFCLQCANNIFIRLFIFYFTKTKYVRV